MITIGGAKFLASKIEPNPLEVGYWIDLSADPNGAIIKYYDGKKWNPISGQNGNYVSSTSITEIRVVEELPEIQETGVLYIKKV